MKILFLRGWRSAVGGMKPTFLAAQGHQVINPVLDDDDFTAAVEMAQREFEQHRPSVVVGSSRGGAVALNMDSRGTPLVLLCPAWKNWGTARKLKQEAVLLHSRQDDVIPFSDSRELLEYNGLPDDMLMEVGSDHRLADDGSLSVLLWACELLTSGKRLPWLGGGDDSPESEIGTAATHAEEDVTYICDACGEEIVIPVDLTEGLAQSYVEDCPVCCRANTIHVEVIHDGQVRVWAEPEQDY